MSADRAAEIQALNRALAGELQLIAAYGFGEDSHLLHCEALELARVYRTHHERHAELLAEAIRKLGGAPIDAEASYDFAVDSLAAEEDVLKLAARLEQCAVGTYLNAMPCFPGLANAASAILGDEAMHCAVLRQALGEAPVFMA
jgi:ferritin-like protein